MIVRQLIPEGLAEMAPGPELGALLAGMDIQLLTGADAIEVLRARARQLSHDQAQLLATMVEVGLCDPDADPALCDRGARAQCDRVLQRGRHRDLHRVAAAHGAGSC